MTERFRFSANTGFLWKDRPFLDRIRAAAAAGFDAVEFHDEAQSEAPAELKAVLEDTGLPVCGLNVRMGATAGCAAAPGEAERAGDDFLKALEVAESVDAGAIHMLAGYAEGPEAAEQYRKVLDFCCGQTDRTVLIEPICRAKMPGYFLKDVDQASEILADVGKPNLKIMFDCFHVREESGDILTAFERVRAAVGHIQIASWPDRSEPGTGEPDYSRLLPAFQAAGYRSCFGCEYVPSGDTDARLAWRDRCRGI